jgi:cytochrome c peroxidase
VNDLTSQAFDATLGHAQAAAAPTAAQLKDIVDFEMSLTSAQATDNDAGNLDAQGGNGGPQSLVPQEFYLGINDPLGLNPTGKPFDAKAMTMYQQWANLNSSSNDKYSDARAAVARGEALFNTLPIPIEGVAGINDVLNQKTVMGNCTTCHDSPNVGDHSVSQPLNIGLVDASRRTPDMPLYTFRCNLTGKTIQVTDPGRALISGRCEDIGKFKGAILRGLASRAPYFHNGSAATLMDAVEFYNTRFNLQLNSQQKSDLVAFLKTL